MGNPYHVCEGILLRGTPRRELGPETGVSQKEPGTRESGTLPPPPVDGRRTDTCENITSNPSYFVRGRFLPFADLTGGTRDTRPFPIGVEFLSFSCSFREKIRQIIGWCPHLGGWRQLLLSPPFGKSCIRHCCGLFTLPVQFLSSPSHERSDLTSHHSIIRFV